MSDLNLSPAALAKANDLLLLLMDGSFHRGEELAEALAISKSAVSKRAQKLLSLDLPLSAVKGRGYRLQNAQQWLQFPLLQTKLSDLDCALSYQPLVDSTNAVLKQRGRLAATELLVCDWQSAGRGRRGRQWHSRA
jgi:BirA family biotin operon repressor/biotin-[acetyl-CoA-carboxylase] ligase